jgi:hypothetical protein
VQQRDRDSNSTRDGKRAVHAASICKLLGRSILAVLGRFVIGAAIANVPVEVVNLLFDTSLRPIQWRRCAWRSACWP